MLNDHFAGCKNRNSQNHANNACNLPSDQQCKNDRQGMHMERTANYLWRDYVALKYLAQGVDNRDKDDHLNGNRRCH